MKYLLVIALGLGLSNSTFADTQTPPVEGEKVAKRNLRIAPVMNIFTGSPMGTDARLGAGLKLNYEFILSPHAAIGIHLASRYFPATMPVFQLGYGLLMRHAFLKPEKKVRPYFEYGLLLQVTRFPGSQTGSGTSHDTRLAFGVDSKLINKVPLFFEVAYHYSRLKYFGTASEKLDRFEIDLGYQFSW